MMREARPLLSVGIDEATSTKGSWLSGRASCRYLSAADDWRSGARRVATVPDAPRRWPRQTPSRPRRAALHVIEKARDRQRHSVASFLCSCLVLRMQEEK